MAWFKCSAELFRTRVVKRIMAPYTARDAGRSTRFFCFIQLLCLASDGVVVKTYSELADMTGVSIKPSTVVWDICVEEKVLRKDRGGYSAVAWMIEQGILGEEYADPVKSKQRRKTKSGEQPAISTTPDYDSEEEEFKSNHDGKTKEEWDEMQRWKTSPEGKAKMEEFQARFKALMG